MSKNQENRVLPPGKNNIFKHQYRHYCFPGLGLGLEFVNDTSDDKSSSKSCWLVADQIRPTVTA